MAKQILITDYAWPDLDIERSILAQVDGELVAAPATDLSTLRALVPTADAIMTCWARLPREVLEVATRCQIVARLGIGLDNIDVACCTELGIPVTNVPDYCVTEVAEHTIALLLSLARNVALHHYQTKHGEYRLQAAPPPRRISGQTLGVIGLGNIGGQVAVLARKIGLRVLAVERPNVSRLEGVRFVSLDELLATSDHVSLHVPLTAATRRMIGAAQLARMKPTAFLINTARGGLVDHEALAAALAANRLAGAALDVQEPEPPDLAVAPYDDPRVIVTPHTAFVSVESVVELRQRATQQVALRLSGVHPPHVVNQTSVV